MPALTGADFVTHLNKFLVQADLEDSAKVWYSFSPQSNQSNFEFVFNDLYTYSEHFVSTVSSATITNSGTNYASGETPTIIFTASGDAGQYASGTGIMKYDNSYSYWRVSGITITNEGQDYVNVPSITIDYPSGGGVRAEAVAVMTPNTGKTYASIYPGFSVGGTNNIISTLIAGTGTFEQTDNDFLRVGYTLKFDDWTVFLNFCHSGYATGNSKVLLSTMDSGTQTSGFLFGISDSNRLFLEYTDNTTYSYPTKRVHVRDWELGTRNLISLSKNATANTITICNHDLAKYGTQAKVYSLQGYTDCNKLYIGGFPNDDSNSLYTGYFGTISDVLILDVAATSNQCDTISKAFFSTGYAPPIAVPVTGTYTIVTGAGFENTIVSSGVSGYSIGPISIPDKDGTIITAYDIVPLVGNITGQNITYYSGITTDTRVTYSDQTESLLYKYSYLQNYTDDNLVFLNTQCSSFDIIEIYHYPSKLFNTINLKPQFFNLYDYYLSDLYQSGTVTYSSGMLKVAGITYPSVYASTPPTINSDYKSNWEYLLQDLLGVVETSGWTGSTNYIYGDPTYSSTYDIYINGQKLISGRDYTVGGGGTVTLTDITPGAWASGTIAFVPIRTTNRTQVTGSSLGYHYSIGNVFDEMIWMNGQRFAWDEDYKIVSDSSLLNYEGRATGLSNFLYSGDYYFDSSILSFKPNIV